MKTRPRKLVYLALFLLLLACSFPVQVMALYGHTPVELGAVAAKLAPLNWAIMVLAPISAWLAYQASPWLMGSLPALTVLVFYNNWLVGTVGEEYSAVLPAVASAGFLLAIAGLLNREALQVILNPQARWWMTPARRRMALPVRFKLLSRAHATRKSEEDYNEFYIRTYDISEGGAFIPLEQIGQSAGTPESRNLRVFSTILKNLAVGTQCYVCLPLKDVNFIQCRAEIVRNTQGRGNYPAGVGIRFLGLSWTERRKLNHFLEQTAA